jgi:hypothetical protein
MKRKKNMKKMTEAQVVQMLKEAAARRYGDPYAPKLLPALRETARAILGTRNQELALEDEPAFFSRSIRIR